MIIDRTGQHEVLLPLNHNHYNFRENKCILLFLLIPTIQIWENNIGRDTAWSAWCYKFVHFGKSPVVVAMVTVINSVIGGFSWVHLIWLANVAGRLQPTVRLQPFTISGEKCTNQILGNCNGYDYSQKEFFRRGSSINTDRFPKQGAERASF